MPAKKIFVFYLLFVLFLHESLQKFLHSSYEKESGVVYQQVDTTVEKRPKRSPCIIGTRWRTRRCRRKGKRAVAFSRVSFVNINETLFFQQGNLSLLSNFS